MRRFGQVLRACVRVSSGRGELLRLANTDGRIYRCHDDADQRVLVNRQPCRSINRSQSRTDCYAAELATGCQPRTVNPALLIETVFESDDVQVTRDVRSCVLPSL